jgi:hypothetical protein
MKENTAECFAHLHLCLQWLARHHPVRVELSHKSSSSYVTPERFQMASPTIANPLSCNLLHTHKTDNCWSPITMNGVQGGTTQYTVTRERIGLRHRLVPSGEFVAFVLGNGEPHIFYILPSPEFPRQTWTAVITYHRIASRLPTSSNLSGR